LLRLSPWRSLENNEKNDMATINEKDLSALLLDNITSVLPDNE
jgi:hypothetical protein